MPFTIVGSIAALCAIGLFLSIPDQSYYDTNNAKWNDDVLTFKNLVKVHQKKSILLVV